MNKYLRNTTYTCPLKTSLSTKEVLTQEINLTESGLHKYTNYLSRSIVKFLFAIVRSNFLHAIKLYQ